MGSRPSFPDAALKIPTPCSWRQTRDAKAITQLAEHLEGLLAAMEPASPTAELLAIGLSGLQNIDKSDGSLVLSAVASAIAASAECLNGEDRQTSVALEAAAAALRELLEPQPKEPSPQAPAPMSEDPTRTVDTCDKDDVLRSYTRCLRVRPRSPQGIRCRVMRPHCPSRGCHPDSRGTSR